MLGDRIIALSRRPLVRQLAQIAAERVAERLGEQPPVVHREIEETIAREIAADPVLINETNNEPWWQSRIFINQMVTGVGAIGMIVNMAFGTAEFDGDALASSIVAVIGLIGTLKARFGSASAPARWWNPISWFR